MDQIRPKEDLLKITKDNCILVEFVNDFDESGNPLLGIGFTNWLEEKDEEDVVILNIKIDDGTKLLISWPENFQVVNFSRKTKQQLENCTFRSTPISILAMGTWDEMKTKQSNMLKFAQKNTPDKSSRHDHKRKEFGNDYVTDLNATKNDAKKVKTTKSNEDDAQLKQKIDSMASLKSQVIYSSDSNDEDEFETELERKDNLIEEKENVIHEKDKEIQKIRETLVEQEKEIKHLKEINEKLETKVRDLQKLSEESTKDMKLLRASKSDLEEIRRIANSRLMTFEKPDSMSDVTNTHNLMKKEKDYSDNEDIENDPKNEKKTGLRNDYHNPHKIRAKHLLPTDFVIQKDVIDSICRKKLKDATYILLRKYFTTDELANSSCTGIASNASNEVPAKALNIQKFNAIRNVLYELHHEKNEKWASLFMNTAKNLIGSCRKSK